MKIQEAVHRVKAITMSAKSPPRCRPSASTQSGRPAAANAACENQGSFHILWARMDATCTNGPWPATQYTVGATGRWETLATQPTTLLLANREATAQRTHYADNLRQQHRETQVAAHTRGHRQRPRQATPCNMQQAAGNRQRTVRESASPIECSSAPGSQIPVRGG